MPLSNRPTKVAELFHAVCELPEAERRALLDEARRDDSSVCAEVEALLAEQAMSVGFLESPAALSLTAASALPRPAQIGNYAIQDVLGVGGMGMVYLAQQASPRRRVALKVISPWRISESRLKRLELEAEALGRLHHPGIAQIYEAGTADIGCGLQPYFAMELIEGKPLLNYVRERLLNTRQRLGLFAMICEAVQHAHQRGVIHRDLKPANILVTEAGQPKILDFGVARVTDLDLNITTLHTDEKKIVGTIKYMSPEQARGDSAALETRSDVYALGVLLYELLSGRLPHDFGDKPIAEAVRMIDQDESIPLGSVDRTLRGDLETIVLKALEKEPGRRYASPLDLASDVRRYLNEEPITAHPPSVSYRLRKFARRHRGMVGGAVLAVLALIVGTTVATWQAVVASAQLKRAEQAEIKAQESQKFLESVFLRARPTDRSSDITLLEALDDAAARLDANPFPNQPLVEASLRKMLGVDFLHLRSFDKALHHLTRERQLMEQLAPVNHELRMENAHNLAYALTEQGRWAEAEPYLEDSLQYFRAQYGSDNMQTLGLMSTYARHYSNAGKPLQAEELYLGTLAGVRRIRSDDHPLALICKGSLGLVYMSLGRSKDAESMFLAALDGRRRALGNDHKDTLTTMHNLAELYRNTARVEEARTLLEEALPGHQRVWGADHLEALTCQIHLVQTLIEQEDFTAAEPLCRDLLRKCRSKSDQHRTLHSSILLARVLRNTGRCAEAINLYDELVTWARSYGQGSELGRFLGARGDCFTQLAGQLDQAEGDLLEAEACLRDDPLSPTHYREVIESLVRVYVTRNAGGDVARWQEVLEELAVGDADEN